MTLYNVKALSYFNNDYSSHYLANFYSILSRILNRRTHAQQFAFFCARFRAVTVILARPGFGFSRAAVFVHLS